MHRAFSRAIGQAPGPTVRGGPRRRAGVSARMPANGPASFSARAVVADLHPSEICGRSRAPSDSPEPIIAGHPPGLHKQKSTGKNLPVLFETEGMALVAG